MIARIEMVLCKSMERLTAGGILRTVLVASSKKRHGMSYDSTFSARKG